MHEPPFSHSWWEHEFVILQWIPARWKVKTVKIITIYSCLHEIFLSLNFLMLTDDADSHCYNYGKMKTISIQSQVHTSVFISEHVHSVYKHAWTNTCASMCMNAFYLWHLVEPKLQKRLSFHLPYSQKRSTDSDKRARKESALENEL